jgi:hypothetical protein
MAKYLKLIIPIKDVINEGNINDPIIVKND